MSAGRLRDVRRWLNGRRWLRVAGLVVVLAAVAATLVLVLSGGSSAPVVASCHPIVGPVRVDESVRATYLPTHLVLVSGSEADPRAAPVVYGLPAPAKADLGPTVTLRVLPSAPLTSLVPAGLVARSVTIRGHAALLATTPKVVGTELAAEIGRVHIYWEATADTVISVTTWEMGESLATAIAQGVSYQPGHLVEVAAARPSECPRSAGG